MHAPRPAEETWEKQPQIRRTRRSGIGCAVERSNDGERFANAVGQTGGSRPQYERDEGAFDEPVIQQLTRKA